MGRKNKKRNKNTIMRQLRVIEGGNFRRNVNRTARRIADAVELGLAGRGRRRKRGKRLNSAVGFGISNWVMGPGPSLHRMRMVPTELVAAISRSLDLRRMLGRRMFRF